MTLSWKFGVDMKENYGYIWMHLIYNLRILIYELFGALEKLNINCCIFFKVF